MKFETIDNIVSKTGNVIGHIVASGFVIGAGYNLINGNYKWAIADAAITGGIEVYKYVNRKSERLRKEALNQIEKNNKYMEEELIPKLDDINKYLKENPNRLAP